jgi:hypothetical protein
MSANLYLLLSKYGADIFWRIPAYGVGHSALQLKLGNMLNAASSARIAIAKPLAG